MKNKCYCCHEENEGKLITSTQDANSEKRWICINCHQIDEVNKLPNLVITK